MRWSNLSIEEEEPTRLPGYRDPAVVRHFEAPGAISTRFYEVRAKSILNRVPEASQMPFRWTINPYRGCTHACTYCGWGGTPVLTADGRHKPLEELEVGEEIYGTTRRGGYRRYARATVLDRWITIKPAYRLVLADGTELIASADHRFLTNRGWKHVVDAAGGRPHLTLRNRLIGTGRFADQPRDSTDYRRGYLTGLIRGDGRLGRYVYRAGGRERRYNHFRLALADTEALVRAKAYLVDADVQTGERLFAAATGAHREMRLIQSSRREDFEAVSALVEWPVLESRNWCQGFLAGIFDAEGSRSAFALRIANTDSQVLHWTEASARRLGFQTARDITRHENGLQYIRIRGGLAEHLRFFHLTDPAITRKRSIVGQMVKTFTDLRVVAVEPLGRALPLYDIKTSTSDFIANGVVSHNCFARPTHKYLDFDSGRDFERQIIVKVNAPERLAVELQRPSWQREHIALGTNTDPYQWVEGRYRLMPGIWQAMIDASNPASVLTKSPLLLRDLALMKELAARADFSAALSIPTLDEKAWRATEPHTPNPHARLEAVAELTRNGIKTGVLVAPLMPGINDDPEQVARILELASQAGAAYVSGIALHLREDVKKLFFEWLAEHRPELVARYRALYRQGAYAPAAERQRLSGLIRGPEPSPAERGRAAYIRAARPKPPSVPVLRQETLFDAPSEVKPAEAGTMS